MPVFCRLAHPDAYHTSPWNIGADPWDRDYWLGLFAEFPHHIERHLREDGLTGDDFERRWAAFVDEYQRELQPYRRLAEGGEVLHTIDLTHFRNGKLRKFGWPDPYIKVKQRENVLAGGLYPRVVERVDATPPADRWNLLFRGLFAGNMFDLGSPKTMEMYDRGEIDFAAMFDRLPGRPWFIDHADALCDRFLSRESYRQALIFVDNAGTDIVLGVMPTARELARLGTRVVLAANTEAALNDITADELRPLVKQLAADDAVLADLLARDRIAVVASGGDTPLIDLGAVSEQCDAEAARSDLIVLEGMGRGVESNWDQAFTCDVWRVALLKDESVVRWLGARLFDAVCRFDSASSIR